MIRRLIEAFVLVMAMLLLIAEMQYVDDALQARAERAQ
jgi:hypothetical protein